MLEVLHPSNGPRMDLYQSRDLANESPVYHAYDEARRALLTIQQLLGGEVKSGDVEVLEGWINNELPAQIEKMRQELHKKSGSVVTFPLHGE